MSHADLRHEQFLALLAEMSDDERAASLRAAASLDPTTLEQEPLTMTSPNPYVAGIRQLRAASGTLEQFDAQDEQIKTILTRAEADAVETQRHLRTLARVDLSAYRPPNSYEAGLKALREKATR